MFSIEFSPEASESCDNALHLIQGFTVEVHPDTKGAKPFDAVMVGTDHTAGWFGSILVRRFDKETGGAVGPPFSVQARKVVVY